MSNLVTNRMRGQIVRPVKENFILNNPVSFQPVSSPAIAPESLKLLLLESLKIASEPAPVVGDTCKLFNHVWDFVEWYEPNRADFSEDQKKALDTLIQVRDMVNTGCGCKRAHRESAANDYFKTFWLNNQTTDLLPTVLKISNSTKLQIGNFLTFPV